jgi:2-deoxystreptamine N-acetyl-D-glucosaminyltransferase/2-deoxystreptamine glucosyltransferase
MNILRVSPYYYFDTGSVKDLDLNYEPLGGMQIQITEQTKAVDPMCNKQVVLTIGLPNIEKKIKKYENTEIISVRLPQPKIKSSSKGMIFLLSSWALGTIFWAYKNRKNKKYNFSIVHHHSSDLLSTFISAPIVAKLLKIPLVITVHCSPNFTFHPSTFFEKLFFTPSKYVEKIVVKNAKHLFVLTERMKQEYIKASFADENKITIIPDGVDIDLFKPIDEEQTNNFLKKYKLPEGKKIISYIGRIAPEKGWDTFLNMANLMKDNNDFYFLVCGDGHTFDSVKKMIDSLGLADIITLTGYISHLEIPAAISASFCVILPSYHEELGGTTLETMACKKVIIASEIGGIPFVVKDEFNGLLVPPSQPQKIVEKIMWLTNNDKKHQEMKENAIKFVRDNYSITSVAKRLYKSYMKNDDK